MIIDGDLVGRLRFALRDWNGKSRTHFPEINALVLKEAAAAIESLQAQLAEAAAEIEKWIAVSHKFEELAGKAARTLAERDAMLARNGEIIRSLLERYPEAQTAHAFVERTD